MVKILSWGTVTSLLLAFSMSGCALVQPARAPAPTPGSVPTLSPTLLPANPPATCPITRPGNIPFTPPSPYPATLTGNYEGQFWYGSPDLWTMLRIDGNWGSLPQSKDGYRHQKVWWWRAGYNMGEEHPELTVTGNRLDAGAPPLLADPATNAAADFGATMLIGVDIPTPGCWKITGHYKGHELPFVVWVAP